MDIGVLIVKIVMIYNVKIMALVKEMNTVWAIVLVQSITRGHDARKVFAKVFVMEMVSAQHDWERHNAHAFLVILAANVNSMDVPDFVQMVAHVP